MIMKSYMIWIPIKWIGIHRRRTQQGATGCLPQGMILAALHALVSRSPLKLAHPGRPAWAGLGLASRTELETVPCACYRLCCLPSQADRQLHNKGVLIWLCRGSPSGEHCWSWLNQDWLDQFSDLLWQSLLLCESLSSSLLFNTLLWYFRLCLWETCRLGCFEVSQNCPLLKIVSSLSSDSSDRHISMKNLSHDLNTQKKLRLM